MSSGAYNRAKGHNWERQVCKELKRFFPQAVTARAGARFEDARGIDVINTHPLNIQTKAREHLNVFDVLYEEMPQDKNLNVLFWKKNRKKDVIVMPKEDFYELLDMIYPIL